MDTLTASRLIELGLRRRTGNQYLVKPVGRSAPGAISIDIDPDRALLPSAPQERAELAAALHIDVESLPRIVPSHGLERRSLLAMRFERKPTE